MKKIFIAIFAALISINISCSTDNWKPKYIMASRAAHVQYGTVPNGKIGYTYFHFDKTDVKILKGLSSAQLRTLITHELFHVLGYVGHLQNDEDCYFYHSPKSSLGGFCDKDIKLLKAAKPDKPIKITASSELAQYTQNAILMLNAAAGKQLFVWDGIK